MGEGKDRGELLWGSNCREESDPGDDGSVVRMAVTTYDKTGKVHRCS